MLEECIVNFPDFPTPDGEDHAFWDSGESLPIFQTWELTYGAPVSAPYKYVDIAEILVRNFYGTDSNKEAWRLVHSPSPTCYLKVWIAEIAEDGTVTELAPYVWNGIGNPCFPDPGKPFNAEENLINGLEGETACPAGSTSVQVIINRFSFLPGYEPDISDPDNPQPSGFPDPAWEPAAP